MTTPDYGPTWTIVLIDAPHITGAAVIGPLSTATAISFEQDLSNGDSVSFTMPGYVTLNGVVQVNPEVLYMGSNGGIPGMWEGECDILLYRDARDGNGPIFMWRGRLGSPTDSANGNYDDTTQWVAVDYKAVLGQRIVTSSPTFSTTDMAQAAWTLINYEQQQPNGAMGITVGQNGFTAGTGNTGKTISTTVDAGTALSDAIDTCLSTSVSTTVNDPYAGGDWYIDKNLQLQVWNRSSTSQGRGVVNNYPLHYGSTVEAYQRVGNLDQYANNIYAVPSSSTTGVNPQTATTADITTDRLGRVDRTVSITTSSDDVIGAQNTAVQTGAYNALYLASQPHPSYSFTMKEGLFNFEFTVGDVLPVYLMSGRLNVDGAQQRVQSIGVTIGDAGDEQVTITTSRPVKNLLRAQRNIEDRLDRLELKT